MADIAFCTAYIILFSFIILKSGFFKLSGFKNLHSLTVFFLKLISGLVLWYIYAHHYKNRITSDIFKYYDDSLIIYNTIHHSFSDFLKMLTGIGDNTPTIKQYYSQMNSWANGYQSGIYNNSHLIIRLNVFFRLLSGSHYGVHVIFMCFISLIGLIYLYKTFYPYLTDKHRELFIAVFLFPSVLLWSSGILKEGIIFLGLGMLLYFFFNQLKHEDSIYRNTFFMALGALLVFETKAYVLLCLLPCFLSEYLIRKVSFCAKKPGLTYLTIVVIYIGLGLSIGILNSHYNPLRMLAAKQLDFNRIARGGIYMMAKADTNQYAYLQVADSSNVIPANPYADTLLHASGVQFLSSTAFTYKERTTHKIAWFRLKTGTKYDMLDLDKKDTTHKVSSDSALYRFEVFDAPANSRIYIAPIKPTPAGLLSNIPGALVISIIRPMPWEIHSSMVLIYFLENIATLLLIICALLFMKKKQESHSLIWFCFTYCLMMLVLIGLVTPLYGGIERYKCVVMPFLLILLLLIYDKQKLMRIFNKSK